MVALALTASAACSSPPPPSGPVSNIWGFGDSIMAGTAQPPSWLGWLSFPVWNLAVSGRAFVGTASGPTIGDTVQWAVNTYGAPQVAIISGGTNDQIQGIPAASVTAAMADIENFLTSKGVEVVWVTAPRMADPSPVLTVTNDWMRHRAHFADCGPLLGEPTLNPIYSIDGIHINNAGDQIMAECVDLVL